MHPRNQHYSLLACLTQQRKYVPAHLVILQFAIVQSILLWNGREWREGCEIYHPCILWFEVLRLISFNPQDQNASGLSRLFYVNNRILSWRCRRGFLIILLLQSNTVLTCFSSFSDIYYYYYFVTSTVSQQRKMAPKTQNWGKLCGQQLFIFRMPGSHINTPITGDSVKVSI